MTDGRAERKDTSLGLDGSHTEFVNMAAAVWVLIKTSAQQGPTGCSGPKRAVREMLPQLVSPSPALLPSHQLWIAAGPSKLVSVKSKITGSRTGSSQDTEHRKLAHTWGSCGSLDTFAHCNASHPPVPFPSCRHWFFSNTPGSAGETFRDNGTKLAHSSASGQTIFRLDE